MTYVHTAAIALSTAAITLLHSGIHVCIYRHMDELFWREICVHVRIIVLCGRNKCWISETLCPKVDDHPVDDYKFDIFSNCIISLERTFVLKRHQF